MANKTYKDLIEEAEAEIETWTAEQAKANHGKESCTVQERLQPHFMLLAVCSNSGFAPKVLTTKTFLRTQVRLMSSTAKVDGEAHWPQRL